MPWSGAEAGAKVLIWLSDDLGLGSERNGGGGVGGRGKILSSKSGTGFAAVPLLRQRTAARGPSLVKTRFSIFVTFSNFPEGETYLFC